MTVVAQQAIVDRIDQATLRYAQQMERENGELREQNQNLKLAIADRDETIQQLMQQLRGTKD